MPFQSDKKFDPKSPEGTFEVVVCVADAANVPAGDNDADDDGGDGADDAEVLFGLGIIIDCVVLFTFTL